MPSNLDIPDCVQLDWTLSFQSTSMRQEFFNFMRKQRTSNLTLLISSLISLVLFLPFNIYILADKSHYQEDVITPMLSCLMICFSISLGCCGMVLYYCGLHNDFVFGRRFYDHISTIQIVFIVVVNINNVLSAYHLAFQSNICDEDWIVSDWYCLGDDRDSSFFSFVSIVTVTPLILLIALRDTRVHLIGICGFFSYVAIVIMASLKHCTNFAVLLTIWSFIMMIILVDVHLARVEKFLQHRKLQLALEDIERLQAANRETELRHMIGNVAHDLKTPLSSINTAIELIGDALKQIEQMVGRCASATDCTVITTTTSFLQTFHFIKQSLYGAHHTINFMFMTINRCIDYTKASKGIKLTPKLETVHWSVALQLSLDCMHHMQEKVEIILQPFDEEICSHIITDKQWLQENVLCLLSNAVKYSNDGIVNVSVALKSHFEVEKQSVNGGKQIIYGSSKKHIRKVSSVSSRTRIIPMEGDECTFSSAILITNNNPEELARESYLCYEIEDNGIGISKEIMEEGLFNPFKQAERFAGGTGLGLYSLAKRMDAMKGYYGVHKRLDDKQGSVFWFAIPYRPDVILTNFLSMEIENEQETSVNKELAMQVAVEEEGIDNALNVKRKKILIVDDSPTIVRMMCMMLTRQGYEVIVAENGMRALERIQTEWKQQQEEEQGSTNAIGISLILMDMQMPIMDGIEATKRLRLLEKQFHRSCPLVVIGMSANSDEETKQEALQAGVNEFLSKPISMALCSQLMAKYIQQG